MSNFVLQIYNHRYMKLFHHFTCLLMCLLCVLPLELRAQDTDETVIEFFSTNATMEDDPNQQNYNITIFSPDGQWKMQLNYNSTSMFGTFGNEEFDLAGKGQYYNYVRNPKNDMVFYSFVDMNVSVTDEGTVYRVKANCLTNNKKRFLVEATIDAPQPKQTLTDDLGYARVEENPFYGTYAIYAENANYKLAYGVVSSQLTGNFYRADMLTPELHDKQTNQDINIIYASAVHTQEGDNTLMTVDLLSEDHILYRLSMYNGPLDVTIEREENITISGATLQDLVDMYGCYLFAGANAMYQFGVAVRPESVEEGKNEWGKEDLNMQYTRLYIVDEDAYVPVYDIHVTLEQVNKAVVLKADVTSMDGVLYHITMYLEDSGFMPDPTETVNIDFGHVSVLDYTQGMGVVGLGAVVPDKYQLRVYLNASKLEGEFTSEDFVMDLCDIMVVGESSYVFHDARYVNASMEKQEDRTLITIDLYGMDDVLYHATMYVDPLQCLQEECIYPIAYKDNVTMMALREGDDNYGEYTMQFQNLDDTFDEDYNIIGDGYFFSFYLAHENKGVAGDYGYSDGTLAEDECHIFYEKGCEVRVAPVAGTLKVEPKEQVKIDLGLQMGIVSTYLYQVNFQFVGQNGCIYRGEGENFLLCIDDEGNMINLTEDTFDSIKDSLAEQGLRVRKVMRDGKIVVERQGETYDLSGKKLAK